jgi:tetratricopeptide (TPR) repeat protein
MSDKFYRRLNLVVGYFPMIAIFCMLGFVAHLEIKDLDLWLHLGMGRHIVENGFQIPTVDILSCTVAGTPWINHEWLFQVIIYLIHQAQGFDGLIFMQVILVSVTGLILFMLGYNKKRQLASVLLFLFIALLYQMRFTIRPDLYSLFFCVIYISILYGFLRSKWSLAVIFIVQVLWSNIHGFFFLGPFLILVVLVSEWIKRHVRLLWEWNHVGRLSNKEYCHLKYGFVVAIIACLFNPLTFRGAWYPVWVFFQISRDSAVFFSYITELQRPITMATLWVVGEYAHYKLLILISLVSFVFNRRKIDIGALLFWLLFLLFSLVAIRNMIYFAFAAYLIIMKNISAVSAHEFSPVKIKDEKFLHLTSMMLKIFLMFWVIQYTINISSNGYYDFDRYERKSEFLGISQRSYPNKAADFLVENKVRGNMFNEFNSGAYLVGRCFPNIKVYIDGRTEVYGPEFFKHHLRIVHEHDLEVLEKDLERYEISIAMLNASVAEVPEKILKYFYEHEDWVLVYLGFDGTVFLKKIPDHLDVIEKHQIDPAMWVTVPLDEYRLGSSKVVPYHFLHRAYALHSLGYSQQALKECEAALTVYPSYPEVFALQGRIYEKFKDFEQAFHNYRLAVSYDSENRVSRTSMGKMYEELNYFDAALNQFRNVRARYPNHPGAYFLMARTLIRKGLPEYSMQYARAGFDMDNRTAKDVIALGDLLIEKGFYREAVDVLEVALPGTFRLPEIHEKLGDALGRLGETFRAREEWEKALESAEGEGRESLLEKLRLTEVLPEEN